jgi:hypothetical protein
MLKFCLSLSLSLDCDLLKFYLGSNIVALIHQIHILTHKYGVPSNTHTKEKPCMKRWVPFCQFVPARPICETK